MPFFAIRNPLPKACEDKLFFELSSVTSAPPEMRPGSAQFPSSSGKMQEFENEYFDRRLKLPGVTYKTAYDSRADYRLYHFYVVRASYRVKGNACYFLLPLLDAARNVHQRATMLINKTSNPGPIMPAASSNSDLSGLIIVKSPSLNDANSVKFG
jgi:hypothetical protein